MELPIPRCFSRILPPPSRGLKAFAGMTRSRFRHSRESGNPLLPLLKFLARQRSDPPPGPAWMSHPMFIDHPQANKPNGERGPDWGVERFLE